MRKSFLIQRTTGNDRRYMAEIDGCEVHNVNVLCRVRFCSMNDCSLDSSDSKTDLKCIENFTKSTMTAGCTILKKLVEHNDRADSTK